MSLPPAYPLIIPLDQLANGTNIGDVLTWNGTSWESEPSSGGLPPTALTGQALVFNGTSWEGSNSIRGVTITNATNATLTISDNKTLTCNNSLTLSGTDGTIMTFPSTSDTLVGLTSSQTLTNKTLTRPIITSESVPSGTTGMIYYDSTENLLRFYNGTMWIYIDMNKPISVTLPNLEASSNSGVFYAIPVVLAIGLMNVTTGSLSPAFPYNGWNASSQLTAVITTSQSTISFVTVAQNNFIEYNFGPQNPGIYSIIFTAMSENRMGIITITENTTGLLIGKVDMYRITNNNYTPSQLEFPFVFAGNSVVLDDLVIRWTSSTKNSAAASPFYSIRLYGYIQLIRIG